MDMEQKLNDQIAENAILIYMKGTPYEPKCGFSARTVQALVECEAKFSYVDILENNEVRSKLPSVSDWPTFPQVFVSGELIGGADIVTQMHESGELKKVLEEALVNWDFDFEKKKSITSDDSFLLNIKNIKKKN